MCMILSTAMKAASKAKPIGQIELPIFIVRSQRVILDADLALVYGIEARVLNQAVQRHMVRFPEDFAFKLTNAEFMSLRSQFLIPDLQLAHKEDLKGNSSQPVMSSPQPVDSQGVFKSAFAGFSKSRRGAAYRPWAFTEHGALMVANILHSPRAVQMSVFVVRAFIKQREQLLANAVIFQRLAEMDKTLLDHDDALRTLWSQLQPLLTPPPESPKPRIGFHAQPN